MFFVVVLMPAVVFFSVYTLDRNGFFDIEKVNITVSTQAAQANFSKPYLENLTTQLEGFKGQSLWRFSLQKVSTLLKQQTWIKDYRISRSWPSQLVVEITPHELAFLFADQQMLAQGLVRPVTTDSIILPVVETVQAPPLAFLKNENLLKDDSRRKKIIDLIKSLPAEGKFSHKMISEIGFDKTDGYWVELTKSNLKVKLGEDQFAVKSARVSQVLDYLDKRDLKARVIDANLSKKVLVRLQQNP